MIHRRIWKIEDNNKSSLEDNEECHFQKYFTCHTNRIDSMCIPLVLDIPREKNPLACIWDDHDNYGYTKW